MQKILVKLHSIHRTTGYMARHTYMLPGVLLILRELLAYVYSACRKDRREFVTRTEWDMMTLPCLFVTYIVFISLNLFQVVLPSLGSNETLVLSNNASRTMLINAEKERYSNLLTYLLVIWILGLYYFCPLVTRTEEAKEPHDIIVPPALTSPLDKSLYRTYHAQQTGSFNFMLVHVTACVFKLGILAVGLHNVFGSDETVLSNSTDFANFTCHMNDRYGLEKPPGIFLYSICTILVVIMTLGQLLNIRQPEVPYRRATALHEHLSAYVFALVLVLDSTGRKVGRLNWVQDNYSAHQEECSHMGIFDPWMAFFIGILTASCFQGLRKLKRQPQVIELEIDGLEYGAEAA